MAISRFSKQSIQLAFPKQQTIWDGISQPAAMDAIGSITLTASATSITFSSIPSTYTHLQLRIFGNATNDGFIYFNGDTVNGNYYRHELYGLGSGTPSSDAFNAPYYDAGGVSSSYPMSHIMDILDYTNTNKNRTLRNLWGYDYNGSGRVGLLSIWWNSSSAINSITLSGRTFSQYSQIALYGIK